MKKSASTKKREHAQFISFLPSLLVVYLICFPFFFDPSGFQEKIIIDVPWVRLFLLNLHINPAYLFFTFLYLAEVCLLGYFLFHSFFRGTGAHPLIRTLAGFVPGYLCVTGMNRLISFFLPGSYAALTMFGLLTVISMLILSRILGEMLRPMSLCKTQRYLGPGLGYLLAFLGVFFFFLIWRLQFARGHHLTGHANPFYIKVFLAAMKGDGFLGRFDHHYDELLFLYPLLAFPCPKPENLKFFFWIMLTFGKACSLFFSYCLARKLRIPALVAWSLVLFIFLGTPSLVPLFYVHFSDSMHPPLAYCPHLGRVFTVLLPAFFLTYFWKLQPAHFTLGRPRTLIALLLLAMGISAISFHAAFYILLTLAALIIYWMLHREDGTPKMGWDPPMVLILFALCLTTYALRGSWHFLYGIPLTLGVLLGLGYALWWLPKTELRGECRCKSIKPRVRASAFIMAAIAAIGCTLGNVFTHLSQRLLESTFAFLGWEFRFPSLVSRGILNHESAGIFLAARNSLALRSGLIPVTVPSVLLRFLLAFGTVFLFAILGLYVLHWAYNKMELGSRMRELQYYRWFVLLYSTLFTLALFLADFVSFGNRNVFTRMRFLDVPYYTLAFLFFVIIGRFAGRRLHLVVFFFALVWSVWPFVFHDRPTQWLLNLRVFLDVVL